MAAWRWVCGFGHPRADCARPWIYAIVEYGTASTKTSSTRRRGANCVKVDCQVISGRYSLNRAVGPSRIPSNKPCSRNSRPVYTKTHWAAIGTCKLYLSTGFHVLVLEGEVLVLVIIIIIIITEFVVRGLQNWPMAHCSYGVANVCKKNREK